MKTKPETKSKIETELFPSIIGCINEYCDHEALNTSDAAKINRLLSDIGNWAEGEGFKHDFTYSGFEIITNAMAKAFCNLEETK